MTGSIYRQCGSENRKGNVSSSPDTQNATSVGGHRLQTEIREPHWLPLREVDVVVVVVVVGGGGAGRQETRAGTWMRSLKT